MPAPKSSSATRQPSARSRAISALEAMKLRTATVSVISNTSRRASMPYSAIRCSMRAIRPSSSRLAPERLIAQVARRLPSGWMRSRLPSAVSTTQRSISGIRP